MHNEQEEPDRMNLQSISATTLAHYNTHAKSFWLGTCDHDVGQNRMSLLSHLQGEAPYSVLDFGCGPGRDLKVFHDLGHEAVGLDGAEQFVAMARHYSGCEVWHQDFLQLQLPDERFHGIFANATLFHIPSQEIARILRELWATLKPGGVLFCSNPRGQNTEGWWGERYSCVYDLPTWQNLCTNAGFHELQHYYRPPGVPRHQQLWLATVWRKVSEQSTRTIK